MKQGNKKRLKDLSKDQIKNYALLGLVLLAIILGGLYRNVGDENASLRRANYALEVELGKIRVNVLKDQRSVLEILVAEGVVTPAELDLLETRIQDTVAQEDKRIKALKQKYGVR